MAKYYLRVDAVNIANFVYDTHDVSTIRGGSFLLLTAIENLAIQFKELLHPIATAASQGIFWFDISDENPEQECQKIRKDVLTHLRDMTKGHATFVAATQQEIPGGYNQALEMLEAQIHWQQWHVPTITIPSPKDSKKECYLDGWRPGVNEYRVDPNISDVYVSDTTQYRRNEGRRLRRTLFQRILGDDAYSEDISVKDLESLAKEPSKGLLSRKIAFIHADGNSFGAIRRQLCKNDEDRAAFDETVQAFRKSFLKTLLEQAASEQDFQTKDDKGNRALRIEVLLWGGDEMTLVVPAWKGWQVVELFYKMATNLQFKDQPLSHRAALIFCHHNAPLLFIRQLAEDIMQRAKDDIKALKPTINHENGDALHYLALESFDMLQGDLDRFLASYYQNINYTDLLISAEDLPTLLNACRTIRSLVARGQVLKIIRAIQLEAPQDISAIVQQMIHPLSRQQAEMLDSAITKLTEIGPSRWYLVSDLWDYLSV